VGRFLLGCLFEPVVVDLRFFVAIGMLVTADRTGETKLVETEGGAASSLSLPLLLDGIDARDILRSSTRRLRAMAADCASTMGTATGATADIILEDRKVTCLEFVERENVRCEVNILMGFFRLLS